MFGKRTALVLVAVLAVAACGGGASPGAGTQAPATQAPATAPAGGGGGGGGANLGTLNLDLGGAKYSYPIMTCVDSGQGLAVIAYTGTLDQNAVALLIPHDSSDPSISGVIDGAPWAIGADPKGTLNGKSGTFSGTDMASDKQVRGDFACTN